MVEGIANLELLAQEVFVEGIAAALGFQALQCPETPAAVDAEDVAEPALRAMDELERGDSL